MYRLQSLPRVLLLAVISLGLFANANGQQNAGARQGSVDVRIYLISSDSQAGAAIPAELRSIANELAKTSGAPVSIAADFMARAASGSTVEGRGFLELAEAAPISALDWRIGLITADGVGSDNVRYILQASRFSFRIHLSPSKGVIGVAGAPQLSDVASFASTRSELRAGVPAVLGSFTLAKPKREFHVVAIVSPLD